VKCPLNADCEKLDGSVIWFANQNEESFNKLINYTRLMYDPITNTIYSFIIDDIWMDYLNHDVS